MAVKTTFPFTTPSNYTFDTLVAEVVSGFGQLTLNRPANETFYVPYTSNLDATFGAGVLTGTGVGGASVSGRKLDLSFGDARSVTYDANLNADSQQVGTIRFLFTPVYSGAPPSNQIIFQLRKAPADNVNLISIQHILDGTIHIFLQDGITLLDKNLGSFSAVSGQDYEFEFNYDITAGDSKFFIDGVQFGATITDTYTRTSEIGQMSIGSSIPSNFKFDNLQIFSTVQHTANYVPGIENIITTLEVINAENLDSFVATEVVSGFDNITYTLIVDNVRKYWDGAAWVNADGTFVQTNTAAEINANAAALTVISFIKVSTHLFSDDESTTPKIDAIVLEYDFNPPDITDKIETLNVFGYIFNSDGTPDLTATVTIRPTVAAEYISENTIIVVDEITVPVDSDGAWEIDLVQSASIGSTKYFFRMNSDNNNRAEFIRTVVGTIQARFEDLPP